MGVIEMLLVLIIIGVLTFLVNRIFPIEGWMKTIINAVIAVITFIWLLQVFGFHTGVGHIHF